VGPREASAPANGEAGGVRGEAGTPRPEVQEIAEISDF
jgi:hypothetical protein